MKVLYNIVPSECETFTALGFFDGVHLGHSEVIAEAVKRSHELGISSCVFTFSRRPKSVITGEQDMLLTTIDEKFNLMERAGVDILYVIDFAELMGMSGEDFVRLILIEKLNCRGVVCGFNYHFGKGGICDSTVLSDICSHFGCKAITKKPVMYEGSAISSSRIRADLQSGNILSVNDMLGRSYGYSLEVVHGRQLGRKIGAPTINQVFPENFCLPKFGVYVSEVKIDGRGYRGITNIGVKPTVGSDRPVSETWILDYSGDLYGKTVDIRLLSFIRAEMKFSSVEELKKQIIEDGKAAAKYK